MDGRNKSGHDEAFGVFSLAVTEQLIPRDDLVFVAMNAGAVERVAAAAAHQEFRAAMADGIVPAAARRGLAGVVVELRQRERVAPQLPRLVDGVGARKFAERDRQRWIAVHQHQHPRVVGLADGDAEKIADADVDRHLHAANGAAQDDVFAMQFDVPDVAVGARVVRVEADRE